MPGFVGVLLSEAVGVLLLGSVGVLLVFVGVLLMVFVGVLLLVLMCCCREVAVGVSCGRVVSQVCWCVVVFRFVGVLLVVIC